jgi:hypothetical protein
MKVLACIFAFYLLLKFLSFLGDFAREVKAGKRIEKTIQLELIIAFIFMGRILGWW